MEVDAADACSHELRAAATHWLLDEVKEWKLQDLKGFKNKRRMNTLKYFDMAHEILRGKTMSAVSVDFNISRSNLRNNLLQILLWIDFYKKLSELGRL
jgi:hypothetical protein